MKGSFYYLVMLFLLISCSEPSKEEAIIGKWEYESIDFSKASGGGDLSTKDQFAIKMLESMLIGTNIEFYKDKTVEITSSMGMSFNQSYSFINDEKYLLCNLFNEKSKSDDPEKFEILDLTRNLLVLETKEGIVYTFKLVE